jgi:hypothetical protein
MTPSEHGHISRRQQRHLKSSGRRGRIKGPTQRGCYLVQGLSCCCSAGIHRRDRRDCESRCHRSGSGIKELKSSEGFTLPGFGTFRVAKTKARKALNPRTGEPVKVQAGKLSGSRSPRLLRRLSDAWYWASHTTWSEQGSEQWHAVVICSVLSPRLGRHRPWLRKSDQRRRLERLG